MSCKEPLIIVVGSLVLWGLVALQLERPVDGSDLPTAGPARAYPGLVDTAVYHDDPEHLWNRLNAVLFMRVDAGGRPYSLDTADPLIWPGSYYLLEEPRHSEARALLEEFVAGGHAQITSPVARALLQNDLWALFDQLAGRTGIRSWPLNTRTEFEQRRQTLRPLVAEAVRALALSGEQIASLPDGTSEQHRRPVCVVSNRRSRADRGP
jgi:hypothetical protein